MNNHLKLPDLNTISRESKRVDFKGAFNPSSRKEWCEIIKDIVAMANSGGGLLLFGIDDKGNNIEFDPSVMLNLDEADITNKIYSYTGENFDNFKIYSFNRNGKEIAVIEIGESNTPLVFEKEGYYKNDMGKDCRAFQQGTIYFRHGAKSETATNRDIRDFINRKIDLEKKSMLNGLRKVVEAPPGYQIKVLPPEVVETTSEDAIPIRFVDDSNAPAYRKINVKNIRIVNDKKALEIKPLNIDSLYPYKLSEVTIEINKKLKGKITISKYDVTCIVSVYKLRENPNLIFKSKYSLPQYSNAFVDWVLKKYKLNKLFFNETREKYLEQRRKKIKSNYKIQIFGTYANLSMSSSFKQKYNIDEDNSQFRVFCKAISLEAANEQAKKIIGINNLFKNDWSKIAPTDYERELLMNMDFIIEVTEGVYLDIREITGSIL